MIASFRRSGLLRRYRSRSLTLLGLVGLCLLLSCGGERDTEPRPPQDTASGTGDLDARVFPPASLPFGKDYGAWSAEWWQWVLSITASDNPLFDETGENASWDNVPSIRFSAPHAQHVSLRDGLPLCRPFTLRNRFLSSVTTAVLALRRPYHAGCTPHTARAGRTQRQTLLPVAHSRRSY